MRNIFDQYLQPENRVTHALMTALNEDRDLLGDFLRKLVKVRPPIPARRLGMLEQRFPGESEAAEDETGRRGIPDGWIFDTEGWCVFIESKVLAPLTGDQIRSHRRTAERRGFGEVTAVAITPKRLKAPPADTVSLEWRQVYAWLRGHSSHSAWAARAAEYFEIAEAKLIDTEQFVEGALTMFSGFHFGPDRPFTYLEGKRVLRLAMNELKQRCDLRDRLGMNAEASGRSAITGQNEDRVWDFLAISGGSERESFTKFPHLTLGVGSQAVEAMVTVPNAVNSRMRKNIVSLRESGFRALADSVLGNLAPLLAKNPGATPWFRGVQRRYPSQRSKPFIDASINFDLRTANAGSGPPKAQPRWLSAAYGSFVAKEGANYQIQMGVIFSYDRCPALRLPEAVDLIAAAWSGCKPLVDLAR